MTTSVETGNDDPIKILGMIIPMIPFLLFRFSAEYLRFRSSVQRGGRLFQNKLIDHGIDSITAEQLTEIYLDGSNFLKYLYATHPSKR